MGFCDAHVHNTKCMVQMIKKKYTKLNRQCDDKNRIKGKHNNRAKKKRENVYFLLIIVYLKLN